MPVYGFLQYHNVRRIVFVVQVFGSPFIQSLFCSVPCVVFFAVFQRIVGDGAGQAVVGTRMGVLVGVIVDPGVAAVSALILVMALGTIAAVLLAIIVRNGVLELCLCVRFILIDKSLSIHVPLELELLVARVQQDRIGGGAIFQKQVGIGSKVKVTDIVRRHTGIITMVALPVMINACTGIGFALCNSIIFLLFEHGNDLIIAHVFVVDGSLEVGDDRFNFSALIDAVAVHFDVLTLFEIGLKFFDFIFQ